MGKYPKDRRGTAQDGHFVSIFALPPVPRYGGRVSAKLSGTSGAQNLSGWSKSLPAHWGLTLWKISSGAAPQPRLTLPNQRSRCVSWREPQGPPLQRDYVHISRLESCSLIRPLRGHLPQGKAFGRPQGSPLRRILRRYCWFGNSRRSCGTALATIFANPGPSGPAGIQTSHSIFARRR